MAHSHIVMDVRVVDERISIIIVQRELSSFAEAALMDAYVRACTPNSGANSGTGAQRWPEVIIFDFTQMNYMNSGGIGLLVTLLIRMNRQRQRMFAYGLSEHYQQIFAMTRLDEAIGVFDSEDEALGTAWRL